MFIGGTAHHATAPGRRMRWSATKPVGQTVAEEKTHNTEKPVQRWKENFIGHEEQEKKRGKTMQLLHRFPLPEYQMLDGGGKLPINSRQGGGKKMPLTLQYSADISK